MELDINDNKLRKLLSLLEDDWSEVDMKDAKGSLCLSDTFHETLVWELNIILPESPIFVGMRGWTRLSDHYLNLEKFKLRPQITSIRRRGCNESNDIDSQKIGSKILGHVLQLNNEKLKGLSEIVRVNIVAREAALLDLLEERNRLLLKQDVS